MRRKIIFDLIKWKNKKERLPLIIHGARQIGKTYIIKEFAKKYYEDFFYINFEKEEILIKEFEKTIDPNILIEKIELFFGRKIIPDQTLLIFDEIQACERALTSLKYFCEEKPEYHIIAAGSLLGVAINREKYSFPVGKVEMLNMYPMDFEEFLLALNKDMLLEKIKNCYKNNSKMDDMAHDMAIDLYKKHLVVGGMPAAVNYYKDENKLIGVIEIHNRILETYIKDMSKYASKTDSIKIQATYNSVPVQLAKENKKFQYKLIKKGASSSMYDIAIEWLNVAGIILKCYKVNNPVHPTDVFVDLSHFKIYTSDTGLLTAKAGLNLYSILESEGNVFKGALVENYVACTLVNNGFNLKYWESTRTAEVDFIIEKENNVIPIEVKSSEHTKSKSLSIYIKEYNPLYAIRISTKNFGFVNNIKSVPLYATFCISKDNL